MQVAQWPVFDLVQVAQFHSSACAIPFTGIKMCLHLVLPVTFSVSHSDCRRSSYIYDVANNYFPIPTTAFRGWPETSASGLVQCGTYMYLLGREKQRGPEEEGSSIGMVLIMKTFAWGILIRLH